MRIGGAPSAVREAQRTGKIDWPALRGCLGEATGNEAVEVMGWTVNQDGGELAMVCRVLPVNVRDRVTLLILGILSMEDAEPLSASLLDLDGDGPPPGSSVTGLTCTRRFDPDLDGPMVLSLLLGIVETEAGDELFAFEGYFEV